MSKKEKTISSLLKSIEDKCSVWNNKLTELPDTICDLTNLLRLDADHNKLTKLPQNMNNKEQAKNREIIIHQGPNFEVKTSNTLIFIYFVLKLV